MEIVKAGIYVPSYKRSADTTTWKIVPGCRYVVRKSEEKLYRAAGVQNVIGVKDELICSFSKVNNWVIENAEETLICIMDDDIESFHYRIGYTLERIDDIGIVLDEICRMLQTMYDLRIGYGGITQTISPYNYNKEIALCGMTGQMRFVNRDVVKARFPEIKFFPDIDFALTELMYNRIIFRPNYFCVRAGLETNGGGNNTTRTSKQRYETYEKIMRPKWGKYFFYNKKNNTPYVTVPR